MKKNFKLVLALIVAVMMIVGSISAVAAPQPEITHSDSDAIASSDSYDQTVTVRGLDTGDVAHFYQIVEWVGSAQGNVKGWKAVAPYDTILNATKLTEVLLGNPNATPNPIPAGISAELAGQLAALASGEGAVVNEDGGAAVYTIPEKKPGLYMAIITPADQDTVYSPVFVASDFNKTIDPNSNVIILSEGATSYNNNAAVKKSKTELTKTASTIEDSSYQDGQWTTTRIGETVSFTVDTKIPSFGAYQSPKFIVKDSLTDLTLKEDTVTIVAPAGLKKGTDYTITTSSTGYTITFDAGYLKKVVTPRDLQITYDAVVATTAPLNVNVEKNEVSTEFSNNPSDSEDYSVKKDITKHFTFTIDADALFGYESVTGESGTEVVKVGIDANGAPISETKTSSWVTSTNQVAGPLEGATFKLYTDSDCQTEYIPKTTAGVDVSPAPTYRSDSQGRIKIEGLDAGTYYLKEITAPDGFVKSNSPVKIEIIANTQEISATEYYDGTEWHTARTSDTDKAYTYKYDELLSYQVKIDGVEAASYTFVHVSDSTESWVKTSDRELPSSIPNVKGVELPSTGGIGTTIFYVGGSLMVLAAAILLITKRRMGIED